MFHTPLCDPLGVRYPIPQGAMQGAGGPALAAAVSNAGALPMPGPLEDTSCL